RRCSGKFRSICRPRKPSARTSRQPLVNPKKIQRRENMNKTFKLTALERSWILYDIGNSAFILMVSTLIPIYFCHLASVAGVDENLYLSYWGYAGSIATVLVAI